MPGIGQPRAEHFPGDGRYETELIDRVRKRHLWPDLGHYILHFVRKAALDRLRSALGAGNLFLHRLQAARSPKVVRHPDRLQGPPFAARVTHATPAKAASAAKAPVHVIVSSSSATPSIAVSTGTESCTAAALMAVIRTRTQYQMT